MFGSSGVTEYLSFEYQTSNGHKVWCEMCVRSVTGDFDHAFGLEKVSWPEIDWDVSQLYLKRKGKFRLIKRQMLDHHDLKRIEDHIY